MKKDINPTRVKNIAIAIVKEKNEGGAEEWNVYLLNMKNEIVKLVMVRSNGYNEDVKTSELRQLIGDVPSNSGIKIEMIQEDVFHLTNQYWVSFMLGDDLQDKKYVFVPGSIDEKNMVFIPILNQKGIVIE